MCSVVTTVASSGSAAAKEATEKDELVNCEDFMTHLDIFNLMDSIGMESIGFREFCAYTLLLASFESGSNN